jgi:iron complex outermembrane receptor protein
MNKFKEESSKINLSVCAILAVAFAAPVAHAQTAAAANPSTDLDEIIVTATRREERLQDVPLAVSVISGGQLSETGFKDLTDVQYALPGVYYGVSPNDAGFRLRGVGTAGGFSSSSEQNVGTVVDGVVIPFGNPVSSLGDIDHIEALKGPQGTQFGKNASSGVINIVTTRPDMNNFSGDAFASYGSLNERDIHGTLNIPLSSTAAFQLFAYDRSYQGFVDNVVLDQEWGGSQSEGARAKLLWNLTPSFSAYLIADYSETRTTGPLQLWTINSLSPVYDPFFSRPFTNLAALGVTPGYNNDISVDNYGNNQKQTNYGVSLQLDYEFADFTLTSLSAYRGMKTFENDFSIDASPLTRFEAQTGDGGNTFISQEIRLTSPQDGIFSYVSGIYLSHQIVGPAPQSGQLHPDPTNPGLVVSISDGIGEAQTGTASQAVFADGALKFSDQWRLLVGGRLNHDHVSASTSSVLDPSLPPFDPPPPFGTGPSGTVPYTPIPYKSATVSKTDFSGRIGPEIKLNNDVMFYGTYARGYLGPTVTYSILSATESNVKPQTVDDVTVGTKTQFFDRRLTFNFNAFYDKYKDLQTSVFDGIEFVTENAGGMTAKGFEVETSYRFTKHAEVNAGYTYARDRFTDYETLCPASVYLLGAAAVAAQCSGSGATYQAAGQALPGAPDNTVTLGANYEHPVFADLSFDAATSFYYRSKVFGAAGDTTTIVPDYDIVNFDLGIGSSSRSWRVGLFARNAFDKHFNSAVIVTPFSTPANPGESVNWATREGRRTLGVSIEGRF